MKVCSKCGAYNGDERTFCVDCSEKLDKPLSQRAEDRIDDSIDDKMEKLYNATDPFGVTLFDKICGTLCAVGLVVITVLFFASLFTDRSCEWNFLGFLFFGLGALDAFVPKALWTFERWRLSFTISNAQDAEPGGFYLFFRRVGIAVFAILGVACVFASFYL